MEQQTMTAIPDLSELAVGRTFVGGLVAQDFAAVHAVLAPDVRLRALLPAGLFEWTGPVAVVDRFERWFGDTDHVEPIEATAGEVGGRLHLRWRLRLQARRLGPGSYVVEQVAYADVDERARIARLDLLCTGYLRERSDG